MSTPPPSTAPAALLASLFALSGVGPVAYAQSESDAEIEQREEEMFGDPSGAGTDASEAEEDESTGDERDGENAPEEDEASEGSTGRDAREAEMFGGDTDDDTDRPTGREPSDLEDRLSEELAAENDPLQLGGVYFGRLNYTILEEGNPEGFPLSQPNITDIYFDARPTDRLRFYTQARLLFDPTVDPDQTGRFGQSREPLDIALDQLWLKFDIDRSVYVTVGRQQTRWGVGRFWQPNDFLFAQKREPLTIFDNRTGVDLVKLHIPVESQGWNFYAVGQLGGANSPDQVGAGGRAEFLVDQTEFALSGTYRENEPLQLGVDVSSGVGLFDLRGAFAALRGLEQTFYRGDFDPETLSRPNPTDWVVPESYRREDEWVFRGLAGAEMGLRVGADDTLYLGGEYFYNGTGYENEDLYPWLLFEGAFRPFYLGRHYAGLYASLPSPGQWDDTSFTASTLGNLSDRSFVSRLDYRLTFLTRLQFYAYGALQYGSRGEFNLRVEIPPIETPGAPEQLSDGLTVPATRARAGLGLQVNF